MARKKNVGKTPATTSQDTFVPEGVRILCINDCCHSGTICDIDSFMYSHDIYSISAAKDDEEAEDVGEGGVLSCAMRRAVRTLSLEHGKQESPGENRTRRLPHIRLAWVQRTLYICLLVLTSAIIICNLYLSLSFFLYLSNFMHKNGNTYRYSRANTFSENVSVSPF